MILTNQHRSLTKTLILYGCVSALLFSPNSSANSWNNVRLTAQNKSAIIAVKNSISTDTNTQLIIGLLVFIIMILSFLTLFYWEKNHQLFLELNQYTINRNSIENPKPSPNEQKEESATLNERQQEIVNLIAFGFSNKQIANKLFISENTVKYHIKNIYHVLHVKNRKAFWLSQN